MIEFDDVDGQIAKVDERGIGATDIVERNGKPKPADAAQARVHLLEVDDLVAFQQLDHQVFAGKAVLIERALQRLEETSVSSREVSTFTET